MNKQPSPLTDSRRRIIEAALDEFAEHGLAGARVDRIAERAGLNKAMIYYHFASKEKLYREIMEEQVEKIVRLLRRSFDEGHDMEETLLAVARYYYEHLDLESRQGRIFLRDIVSGEGVARVLFPEMLTRGGLRQQIVKRLEQGRKQGRCRDVDFRQAIISFIGMNLFYLLMAPVVNSVWEIKDDKKFKKERPEAIVDLFLHGLLVK